MAVLSDIANGDKTKIENLKKAEILKAGHDLAGRQVLELLAVEHGQSRLAFGVAEFVTRAVMNTLTRGAPVPDVQRVLAKLC